MNRKVVDRKDVSDDGIYTVVFKTKKGARHYDVKHITGAPRTLVEIISDLRAATIQLESLLQNDLLDIPAACSASTAAVIAAVDVAAVLEVLGGGVNNITFLTRQLGTSGFRI
jgi:hypothetical protein